MDEEKSCWMKIWWLANFSSNIFKLIQHNFHDGSVYCLFHPTFHSYDVILNVNTVRWPLCISCGEIKPSMCFKTVSKSSTLIRNISVNAYRSSGMSSFIMLWKEPNWCLHFIHCRVIPWRGFTSSESTSSDSITGKSMSVAIFDLTSNERVNGLLCWMKHDGWHVETI